MPQLPFITFEGSEGCGKSTQVQRLVAHLESLGVPIVVTREPGGTFIGEQIRQLLQYTPEAGNMAPEAELLLFEASRAQLVREVIEPARREGRCVISDRFYDSTTVYQGVARRLEVDIVGHLNRFAVGACVPDLTFVLDIDVETARARMLRRVRPAVPDRMEQEPLPFYEKVCQAYRALAATEARFRLLKAARSIEEIARDVWEQAAPFFEKLENTARPSPVA